MKRPLIHSSIHPFSYSLTILFIQHGLLYCLALSVNVRNGEDGQCSAFSRHSNAKLVQTPRHLRRKKGTNSYEF